MKTYNAPEVIKKQKEQQKLDEALTHEQMLADSITTAGEPVTATPFEITSVSASKNRVINLINIINRTDQRNDLRDILIEYSKWLQEHKTEPYTVDFVDQFLKRTNDR